MQSKRDITEVSDFRSVFVGVREAFNNWTYQPTRDKETLVYDFYLLSALPEPMDESLKVALNDSRHNLYSYMKDTMLEGLFTVIASEFYHIYDVNFTDAQRSEFFAKWNWSSLSDVYKKSLPAIERNRSLSAQIVRSLGENDLLFVQLAKDAFTSLRWIGGYGGKKWVNICGAYMELSNTPETALGPLAAHIDHILSIEHNTGVIFTKILAYYKDDSIDWLKKALDFTFNAKSLYEYLELVSPDLKQFAAAVIKDTQGTDYEGWVVGANTERVFYRTGTSAMLFDRRYVYKYAPKFANNISETALSVSPSVSVVTMVNNFKYTPVFPMYRLYLVESMFGERMLVDERGLCEIR